MAKYSESVLESIKSRLTMSEVVSPYVRLTRKGDRYWGLCPFHNEKNPSFTVVDNGGNGSGFYKCFSCGKGGGLFDFVMEYNHVEFPEAVEILAKQAGVELKEESEAEKKEQGRRNAMGDMYNRLCSYLHKYLLRSPAAEKAREYIRRRGITDETCETFQLGYIPPQGEWTYNLLKKQEYSDELIWSSGLVYRDRENKGFFRDRIMFPIRNWQGNCVAFSGRDMSGFSEAPKYKNSSDSALYSKRNVLFGFYESLKAMKENRKIIICEGNFDVISLHQAGLNYSCATCGTALTDEHIKMIKRYCDSIYLLFDSDEAGQKATREALVRCQKQGLAGFVMKLEGAKDASQMLEEQGAQALQESCVNSIRGFSYLVSSALKMYDIRQPKGKTSVLKEVKGYLDATESEIERQDYINYLSNALRVPAEHVMSDYQRQRTEAPAQAYDMKPAETIELNPLKTSTELNAMLILMKNRDRFEKFRSEIKLNHLKDNAARTLYIVLEDAVRQDIGSDDLILQMIDDPQLRSLVVTAFTSEMYRRMDVDRTLDDAVYQIRLAQLEESRASVQRMLNGEIDITDEQELDNLLQAKLELDRKIQELKGEMEG